MIHPLVIRQCGKVLTISGSDLAELLNKPRPILWDNKGLFAIVPTERVWNAVSVFKDRQHCKKTGSIVFHWFEAVEILREAGAVMEKYNGRKNGTKHSDSSRKGDK